MWKKVEGVYRELKYVDKEDRSIEPLGPGCGFPSWEEKGELVYENSAGEVRAVILVDCKTGEITSPDETHNLFPHNNTFSQAK